MANGWDSYFHNLPPLSSDTSTLRRTSESEESLSQQIENFIGHNDLPGQLDSNEDLAANPNFNTNYYSVPSIGNSSSDCVYQRYYKESQWQADGEQIEKDHLPRSGNGDIDFTTDGLSTLESFPPSFAADLQGLKQDCGMLAASFLENYSDVSSCSDADVGETRPSCKFMASNSVPKPKTDVTLKNSSSEWLFSHTGNMTFPAEGLCPNMSETNVILTSPSNVKAGENTVECAQDKMEIPEKNSVTFNMVTTAERETGGDNNDTDGCEDQKQRENVERNLTQGNNSAMLISGNENLTGEEIERHPDGNKEEQYPETALNTMTTFDNEQDYLDEKVLSNKMKESVDQENGGFENPNSTDGQAGNVSEDKQNKVEVPQGERKESSSFQYENFDRQKSPNPNSTDGPDVNMETDCQDKKILSNTSQSSDPPIIKVSNFQDATHELKENTSALKSNSHDVETCWQLSEHQSCDSVAQENTTWSPAGTRGGLLNDASNNIEQSIESQSESFLKPNSFDTDQNPCSEKRCTSSPGLNSDMSIDTSSKNRQGIASHVESCLQQDSTDSDPSLEKEMSSSLENKTTTSPTDRNCGVTVKRNDNKEQNVPENSEFCVQPDTSSTDINSCVENSRVEKKESEDEKAITSDSCFNGTGYTSDILSIDTCDRNNQGIASHVESCLKPKSSSADINPYQKKEMTNLLENKTTTLPTDPDHSALVRINELCALSDTTRTDNNLCLEKEWTSQADSTNTISSQDQQQALHQSPLTLEPESWSRDVSENARESFEELDRLTEEPSCLGVLYGEPLSREDSLCDNDETKLDTSQYKGISMARPDNNSMDHSEGQALKEETSVQLRKRLQPVVILNNLESLNGMSNSYRCASCQHTTLSVDHLIEHHHFSHLVNNFQFCKSCNLYLVNEQAEKHLCGVTKENPQLPSDSSPQKKRKRHGHHRCMRCGLIFSKILQYIKHMRTHTGKTPFRCNGCGLYFAQSGSLQRHKRIPGRCKQSKSPATDSRDVINEPKTPPKKDLVQNEQCSHLTKCYVKLVDISKTNLCRVCGKSFLTAEKAKRHFNIIHKRKLSQLIPKSEDDESQKVENVTKEKHKCPLCPRLFKYSYNRNRHLRDCVRDSVFGGKGKFAGKYRCPLCHATFTLPSNRYRHINTVCLKDTINRLAKKPAKLRPETEQKTEKEFEQKTLSKENEEEKQEAQALHAPDAVPRYKCNVCPAVFCHASGKYKHMKKHELFKLTGKMFRYRNSAFSSMSKTATLRCTKTKEDKDNLKPTENSSLALSCHFCGKYFGTLQSLKKHERSHKGEKPYRCLECGKGFKKRAYLLGHKSVHQKRIQCTVCRKILPNVGELIKHRSSHLKRGKLKCPDCHLQFQYPAYLLRHLVRHKNQENKEPQLEEKPQLIPQHSLESVKEQSVPKQLQCSLCKEVFNDAQVLRKHCLTHISGSSSNQCPFCKLDFTSRRCLLRHMVKHTGEKPFSCNNCGKQFYRYLYLKLHSDKCFPDAKANGAHQCCFCPRVFSKKMRLKSHHHGHKTNTLLLCSRCGQYFGSRKLNHHQKNCFERQVSIGLSTPNEDLNTSTSQTNQTVHKMALQSNATKMLEFKCSYCTQRFRYRSSLLRHLVSHTGVQPYACIHCGHRFRSQTMCLQHEAFCDGVHKEGLSKVKSDEGKQLSNIPTLREAVQKSQTEGEVEYKCKFCTKTFLKPRNLRRHILTHNEVKPYRCKACDSCFSRYDHLKVHQTCCKGKKTRLEICIPKISLDDIGRGWKSKFGIEPAKNPETFECEICSRSFSTQSKLSRHNTMFHVTKLFKCTHCGTSFAHEKTLKNHRKMRKCSKVFKDTNVSLSLEANPSTENVIKPLNAVRNKILERIQPGFNKKYKYVCSYCPRAFSNSYQLNVHIRLHTGERPYSCDYCGQRFIRKDYLQRHFPKCTKKLQHNKVLCDRCGEFFPQVKLENHKKGCTLTPSVSKSTVCQIQIQQSSSQSPPKGFSCAYCSSRFLLFSQLQEHFLNAHKMETVVPPVSTAPLQHHLSNILSIKEEPLDENCSEQLSDGANVICKLDPALNTEVPRPFTCKECNMSFVSKAGLIGHQRTHTVVHPYNCKTCKRGYWNKSLLRNHYRKCRFGRVLDRKTTQQLEVPLKAEIDFAINDSVLLFKKGSKTSGTGVLQTNFSCKDDTMDESSQHSDENKAQSSSNTEKKAVQYQCSECDKSFTDGLMLISHLEDHGRQEQEKKRNTCTKCGRVCSSQGNLERHLRMHGINKKYSCSDCSKTFYTFADLEIHRACHDQSRPYACKLCNQRFLTRPSLCNHYREDHTDDIYTCRFCKRAYAVKKSLARHYRKWHQKEQRDHGSAVQEKSNIEQQSSSQVSTTGESDEDGNNGSEDSDSDSAPYFPCHVCGKTFPTSESLEDHQRCHLGEKPHECAECGRCFFQASQLQQHQRMHKSEFQCQACGRGFVSLFALRKHKHTHGKSRPYRCSKCHLSFTGPSQLAEHMSTHREENFPCDICNRMFLSKSSRAEHRKIHSKSDSHQPFSVSREEHKKSASLSESSSLFNKELKYRCGVCSDRFEDPETLSEHGCIAAKERPYTCLDCNKHFLHASHLKKHRTTHKRSWSRGEYPCNKCEISFSSPQLFHGHLMSHIRTAAVMKSNSGDKDQDPSQGFICPICQKSFAGATELIPHFTAHPECTFECKMCKMTFPSRDTLDEHECCHLTSATEFECAVCGHSFLGRNTFLQHYCHRQKHTKMKTSNLSAQTSKATHQKAPGEEEEIDVTGEDLHYCPICSMQFSSKSSLLEHQNKQHSNEKPFKCDLCGKTFARKRYLREHKRRHSLKSVAHNPAQSAESDLKCIPCHTKFSTAQELSLHMRLHAEREVGEYRCDMCYKSFSKWSLLKQHQESHVGQVVYECTECDKAFAFPHLLEEHQQTHAGSSQ